MSSISPTASGKEKEVSDLQGHKGFPCQATPWCLSPQYFSGEEQNFGPSLKKSTSPSCLLSTRLPVPGLISGTCIIEGRMSLPRLSSISRVGVRKFWAWVIFFCWVVLCIAAVFPLFLMSQTNTFSSYHYSNLACIISWI